MYTNEQICRKVNEIFPGIGECGKELDVHYIKDLKVWEIGFEKDGNNVRTYLDPDDAESCLGRNECIGLGVKIGQF